MPSALAQVVLFVSSYAPLLVVLALLDSFDSAPVRLALATLAVASVPALWSLVRLARTIEPVELRVDRSGRRDGDTSGYVVTYLLPFLGIPFESGRGQIAVGIFFLTIGVLYVRSQLFYVNPLLALAGFRLLEIEADDRRVVLLIRTQRSVRDTVVAHSIGPDVYLEAR